MQLKSAYEKSRILEPIAVVSDKPVAASCRLKLSPLSAQAVLRVTSIVRKELFCVYSIEARTSRLGDSKHDMLVLFIELGSRVIILS